MCTEILIPHEPPCGKPSLHRGTSTVDGTRMAFPPFSSFHATLKHTSAEMNNSPAQVDLISRDVVIRENGHGLGVFAARDFRPDEKILVFDAIFVTSPHTHTIQVDEAKHLQTESHIGSLLSHSCAPNTRFCSEQLGIFALFSIRTGEEFTFNYLCTEWDMTAPFECRCGSEPCYRLIKGFRYLSPEDQRTLEPYALPYLRKRIESAVPQLL